VPVEEQQGQSCQRQRGERPWQGRPCAVPRFRHEPPPPACARQARGDRGRDEHGQERPWHLLGHSLSSDRPGPGQRPLIVAAVREPAGEQGETSRDRIRLRPGQQDDSGGEAGTEMGGQRDQASDQHEPGRIGRIGQIEQVLVGAERERYQDCAEGAAPGGGSQPVRHQHEPECCRLGEFFQQTGFQPAGCQRAAADPDPGCQRRQDGEGRQERPQHDSHGKRAGDEPARPGLPSAASREQHQHGRHRERQGQPEHQRPLPRPKPATRPASPPRPSAAAITTTGRASGQSRGATPAPERPPDTASRR
jgi:hypothetical protein